MANKENKNMVTVNNNSNGLESYSDFANRIKTAISDESIKTLDVERNTIKNEDGSEIETASLVINVDGNDRAINNITVINAYNDLRNGALAHKEIDYHLAKLYAEVKDKEYYKDAGFNTALEFINHANASVGQAPVSKDTFSKLSIVGKLFITRDENGTAKPLRELLGFSVWNIAEMLPLIKDEKGNYDPELIATAIVPALNDRSITVGSKQSAIRDFVKTKKSGGTVKEKSKTRSKKENDRNAVIAESYKKYIETAISAIGDLEKLANDVESQVTNERFSIDREYVLEIARTVRGQVGRLKGAVEKEVTSEN